MKEYLNQRMWEEMNEYRTEIKRFYIWARYLVLNGTGIKVSGVPDYQMFEEI